MTAYRDCSGDLWTQQEDGLYKFGELYARTLERVQSAYGPLTPVPDDTAEEAPRMSREEALAKATEQVNALATNGRGFQDGVRFADKVDAVERLARFLAGDQKEV